MNADIARKLKTNPHYKMSAKQKEEVKNHNIPQVVEFGVPSIHNDHVEKHDVIVHKKRRSYIKKPRGI